MTHRMTLLELNEANVELVQKYIHDGLDLPNFKKLIDNGFRKSSSESEYELIEPWIQWPSVHLGMTAAEHGIFRLGDCIHSSDEQIFEKIENKGLKVGCISPMNARNNLRNPAFFIPDPWSSTKTDGSWRSKSIHSAISRAVNDNSSNKLDFWSLTKLAIAIGLTITPLALFRLIRKLPSLKHKGYKRAIFLDCLLTEIYVTLAQKNKIHFGVLFLNGIAHIQHHYLHSSKQSENPELNPGWYASNDPFKFALKYYDEILGRVLRLKGFDTIVATGLSQELFERPIFYYRLKEHKKFLRILNINFLEVQPRMTRDFLIIFASNEDRDSAKKTLEKLEINNVKMFGQIEVRSHELFVTLDYPNEIEKGVAVSGLSLNVELDIFDEVNFVALKNGHHSQVGYVLASDWSKLDFSEGSHIKSLSETISKFYALPIL